MSRPSGTRPSRLIIHSTPSDSVDPLGTSRELGGMDENSTASGHAHQCDPTSAQRGMITKEVCRLLWEKNMASCRPSRKASLLRSEVNRDTDSVVKL